MRHTDLFKPGPGAVDDRDAKVVNYLSIFRGHSLSAIWAQHESLERGAEIHLLDETCSSQMCVGMEFRHNLGQARLDVCDLRTWRHAHADNTLVPILHSLRPVHRLGSHCSKSHIRSFTSMPLLGGSCCPSVKRSSAAPALEYRALLCPLLLP